MDLPIIIIRVSPLSFLGASGVIFIFMPPTSKKLRGHIGLGLSVQSVSLYVIREHSVRNR